MIDQVNVRPHGSGGAYDAYDACDACDTFCDGDGDRGGNGDGVSAPASVSASTPGRNVLFSVINKKIKNILQMGPFMNYGGVLSPCHVLDVQLVYCVKNFEVCYGKERTWFMSCSYMNGVCIRPPLPH